MLPESSFVLQISLEKAGDHLNKERGTPNYLVYCSLSGFPLYEAWDTSLPVQLLFQSISSSNEIETIGHVILYCPLYRDSRKELIEPILRKIPRSTDDTYIRHLLADKEPEIIRSVAKYCYIATRIRRAMMSTKEYKL
ncbi:Hypothetical predicted protein [Podarcis lilfordi]|uniref:Uncharacterized protein n=1 Tax=Podarcis lilfordi TaxID=74358 RepID=A0AA35L345_9SAUR|nr:Hypothetical predicted protein [Podarcis lilfordi]